MRDILTPCLTATAILCVYLFACGIAVSDGEGLDVVTDRAAAPFREMTPLSAAVLGTAIIALTLALVLPRDFSTPRSRDAWARILQLALLLDIALVGGVIFLLMLPQLGWYPSFAPSPPALGALYLAGMLEAAVGTVIVLVLCFFEKSRLIFASTVLVHVAELGLLGWIFFLGTRI